MLDCSIRVTCNKGKIKLAALISASYKMASTLAEFKQQLFPYTIQKEFIDEVKKLVMVLTDLLVRSNIVVLRVH